MPATFVELLHLSKSFPGVIALQDVDLTLRAGSIHALVGENGAGKSTLINILSGVIQPDSGEIRIAGKPVQFADARDARRRGIIAVHQEVDLFPDLTVAENIALEQGLPTNRLGLIIWGAVRANTRSALQAVGGGMRPMALAGMLTPARRQLVEIASALGHPERVLILDEPTSSLSEAEMQVLFGYVRRFRAAGAAILYVSHRLEEIFAIADEVTVLRDGRRVWAGAIAQSTPRQLIGWMVGREYQMPTPRLRPRAAKEDQAIRLSCRDLSASDGSFSDLTLDVRAGEILGLYGLIGAGRTEWAQALFGLRSIRHGEIRLNGKPLTPRGPGDMVRQGLAYVPEDRLRQGLCRGLAVRANVVLASLRQLARGLWISRGAEVRRTHDAVGQLAVRLRSIEQPAGTLSGGNQQKVVLGRWLGRDPQVLILDEPTRGVDVGAKAELHKLIERMADEGRAIVFISSDLPEVLAQCDRVGVFREGRLAGIFDAQAASAEEIAATAMPLGQEKRREHAVVLSRFAISPLFREAALAIVLIALFGFLEFRTGRFLTADSVRNVATDAALLGLCAVGAAIVIMGGGLDISLGALMALSAGVAGRLWEQGTPFPIAVAAAITLGGFGGLTNATLSLVSRVHPIVITLGTMSLYRGLTLWWIEQDVQIPGMARGWIFEKVGVLPAVAWLSLLLLFTTWFLLNWTRPGREVYALGSNPSAARRVGIHHSRVWLTTFTIQGMLAGLAGLVYLARSGNLQPTSFEDKTLEAIAAVVVGGVAITGGRGSVWGVALGCVLLASLGPACIFLQISTHWQRTLVGGVMLLAVLVDALWRRRLG